MKTKNCVGAWTVVCTLALVVLLAGAGPVRADTLYSYDFESLSAGTISGQDSWGPLVPGWAYPTISSNPTGSVDTTQVVGTTGVMLGSVGSSRSIPSIYFTSADTNVEEELWAYTSDANPAGGASGGFTFAGKNKWFLLPGLSGGQTSYYNGTWLAGDTLTAGDWYQIKLTMDFSTVGGLATLYYKDLTTPDADFTMDGTLQNVPMGLTPDGLGRYEVNGMSVRIDNGAGPIPVNAYVDNLSLSAPVPEPGTLALLATGLLGLVAYAWRRQR
jgi:hypothetical protein